MFATTVGKINIYEDFVPLVWHWCVEVAAPYKPHINNFAQFSRADDIRPYNRAITALRLLYAGKTPHFNIPQERRAPAE